MFSGPFAGIAPSSVQAFIAAQVIGGVLAVAVIRALYTGVTRAEAFDIIVPHHRDRPGAETQADLAEQARTTRELPMEATHPRAGLLTIAGRGNRQAEWEIPCT